MQMQLHALNGIQETIAGLKAQAAGYRAQRDAKAKEAEVLRGRVSQMQTQIRQMEQDGEVTNIQMNSARSLLTLLQTNLTRATNEAMLLEQRAATIEGSIISLTLQAQTQVAAPVAVAAPAPVVATPPAPVVATPPASVVATPPASVIVTAPVTVTEPEPVAPGTMTKASAGSFVATPQVPEAPLPVTLPPISRLQPAAASAPGAPISEPAPATDLQKLLPWALAAGVAFLFMNKSKRKRRYA